MVNANTSTCNKSSVYKCATHIYMCSYVWQYAFASAGGASEIFLKKKYRNADFGEKKYKKVRKQKKV